jgi:Dolichyl-phosphate-mannose-protein mannosyltransferase
MPRAATFARRRSEAIRTAWPPGAPGYVLLALLITGTALRLIAIASWWPVATTIDDHYELFAGSNVFSNLVHPAGYSLILAGLGALTHQVALPVLVQHLGGIASALLLWAATRRVTGSEWAGLLPAGVVLLDPDVIYLEHSIMAESSAIFFTSVGLYAAVRAFDESAGWWRWSLLGGGALAFAATIRTAGLALIPVAVLALLLSRPISLLSWRRWRAPAATAAGAGLILLVYATLHAAFGNGFGVRPSPGWYLYGRAAQFAECNRFTPPAGTRLLCETRPPSKRRGASWYWGLGYAAASKAPGPHYLGPFGNHDALIGDWARRAILAQPLDYAGSVWEYLQGYWFPGSPPRRPDSGVGLDPQLAFSGGYSAPQLLAIAVSVQDTLQEFYDRFTVHTYQPGLDFLRAWQRVVRFGPLAMSIATLLTVVGLAVGSRRSRIGVLLFGVGGLALIVAPALTANYAGRYLVPLAGSMGAASAIAIVELGRRLRQPARPA